MSLESSGTEETATAEEAVEEEVSKWPLPFNIGIDKLDIIVRGLFQAEADRHSVSLSDLAERTGIHQKTLGPNIKFLSVIGIVEGEKGKKDAYLLTEKGTTYVKALGSGDITQASTILKELFVSSNLKGLVDFVEVRKSAKDLNFDMLFSQIKTMARLREDAKYPRGVAAPYRVGIYTLIDLLKRANIVPAEVKPEKEPSRAAMPARKVQRLEPQVSPTQMATTQSISTARPSESLPFIINISVEAKDAESIKQLIDLIRELRGKTGEQASQAQQS